MYRKINSIFKKIRHRNVKLINTYSNSKDHYHIRKNDREPQHKLMVFTCRVVPVLMLRWPVFLNSGIELTLDKIRLDLE